MSNKIKRFSGISLMRAIATLGIMLYHVGFSQYYLKSVKFSAGVHIFFCISAFLIMYSTQKKTAGKFIIGRLIRIVPLYLILTVATFIAAKLIAGLWDSDITIKELIYSALFIPYGRKGLTGDNVIRPIMGHGWTLYYEIWFAVLFTVAMKIKNKARGIISAAFCIISYIAALIIPGNLAVLRLLRTGFMLDFAAGIVIFMIWEKYSDRISRLPRYIWYILITVLCTAFYIGPKNIFFRCTLAAIILLCAIAALDKKDVIKPISIFADISYSFYLIHYYIIIILGKFFNFNVLSFKSVIGTIAVFILTFICSLVSHMLIEKKLCSCLMKLTTKIQALAKKN